MLGWVLGPLHFDEIHTSWESRGPPLSMPPPPPLQQNMSSKRGRTMQSWHQGRDIYTHMCNISWQRHRYYMCIACIYMMCTYIYSIFIYMIYIYISQVKGFGLVSHVFIFASLFLIPSQPSPKVMQAEFEAVHLGYWWPESRVLMGKWKSPWGNPPS